MSSPPLRLRVEAASRKQVWEEEWPFPFRGPLLNESVEEYLVNRTRHARSARSVELTFCIADAPLSAEEETRNSGDFRSFFALKADAAELEFQVNKREALHSLYIALGVTFAAVALALFLYFGLGLQPLFVAFLLIVLVWVFMWDALEKLLFESIFMRMRVRALSKLRDARISFEAPPPRARP